MHKTHTYTPYSAKGASLKLTEILAKSQGKTQTKAEVMKYRPIKHAHTDIKNARNVLDRLMNHSAKPGTSTIESVTSEVEL